MSFFFCCPSVYNFRSVRRLHLHLTIAALRSAPSGGTDASVAEHGVLNAGATVETGLRDTGVPTPSQRHGQRGFCAGVEGRMVGVDVNKGEMYIYHVSNKPST